MMDDDFATAKGNEYYRKMKIDQDKIDEVADKLSSIMPAGTPQEVLAKLEETNRIVGLQGFLPHFHFGSMPRNEAVRNIKLFAQTCLPEIKSWPAEQSFAQPK
jgi:hypothetical protein